MQWKQTLFLQIFGLVAFIEQRENNNNDNLCKIYEGLYIASALMKTTNNDVIVKATMDSTYIVIVIVFFLLDKGHEAENLQKECLFLLHYHFPMEDSSESFEKFMCKMDI